MAYSRISHQTGYTLIELLLYVSIIGGLLVSVAFFFGVVADSRVKNQTITAVNQQGAAVMDAITQTIHNATSITSPTTGTSGSSLTLVVPTGSQSPTVYSLSGTALQQKLGAAAATSITTTDVQVTSLTFTNLTRTGTNGILRISFTIKYTNPSSRPEYDYQKTFTTSAAIGW
jgi:type II secretory pathway pseudopilin PulG